MNIIASSKIKTLVGEALLCLRYTPSPDCFVSNAAAKELSELGIDIMPEIEKVIFEISEKIGFAAKNHNDILREYPGLLDLWTEYFRVSKDDNLNHVASFLSSLDSKTLFTAIISFKPIWGDKGYGPTLPQILVDIVKNASQCDDEIISELAKNQLRNVWLNTI